MIVTNGPTTRGDYARRILRVLVHVQQHLDEQLPLEDLAAVAGFSPYHFHRVFRGMVGESVAQYTRRLRLERAAMQLRHGRRPITMIAFEAGYQTHESFTRAFNAAFGCSPSVYRGSARIDAPSGAHMCGDGETVNFDPLTDETHPMKVELRTIEPIRVVFLRHVGPYEQVGPAWERLADWAGARGLIHGDSRFFGACYDDPEVTAAEHLRYDACISVTRPVEPDGEVGVQTIGGGRYACTMHEGPYARLGETYAALYGRWLPGHDYEPGPPPGLESYLNEPDCTPEAELLTDVCVPVATA